MRETGKSGYKAKLVRKLRRMFPGCEIIHNNPNEQQGVPDLLILYGNTWAALEVKASASSRTRPNQPWYVEHWNEMSFSAFIYPENEEEVLDGLQAAFRSSRSALVSRR